MPSNIELSEQAKQECAEALSKVLADSYFLYLKTHNYHWNVEGPSFKAVHEMLEEQYTDVWNAIDDIAERIRALGHYAPGTYAKYAKLTSVKENEDIPDAMSMVKELANDNQIVVNTLRSALSVAQEHGDESSATIVGDRLATHEKTIWMLKSTAA